ncbi:MAG: NAD-dependent epimerase/dehydratase family protein, partial [Dehalococcoidia bacterium]
MTQKILVVGATGNVGSGVLAALVARGADVRGLAHSEAGLAVIRQAGAEPVAGELTEPSSLCASPRTSAPRATSAARTPLPTFPVAPT